MTPDEFMAFQVAWKSLELQLIIRGSQTILMKFTHATLGLHVEKDKVFMIDGSTHKIDRAVHIGNSDDLVWACTNGDVIHEILSNTPSAKYIYPTGKINVQLLPNGFWPDEVIARMHTPLDADIKALVQWFVACWAMNTGPSAAGGIQLPIVEDLEAGLRLFVNTIHLNQGTIDHGSGNTSSGTSSDTLSDTTDKEHEFASTTSLLSNLGNDTMDVLPELEALNLFPQDDEDFHRISLNIGACANEAEGTVHGLYAYVQHHSNMKKCPPILIVVGPEIDTLDDLGNQMDEEDRGLRFDIPDFFSRYDAKNVYLLWPFRVVQVHYRDVDSTKVNPNELRALLKYCFILAAESRVNGYKNHRIPTNDDFHKQLGAVCKRMHWALENGHSTAPGANYVRKLQRRLKRVAEANSGRGTRTAGNAEDDALHTGYNELNDVPRRILDNLPHESSSASRSIEEPPEFDLPETSRNKRQSRVALHRHASFPDGRAEPLPASSPLQARTPASRHNSSSPGGRIERDQAPSPDLAHTPTPRQRSHAGPAKGKAPEADWTSSVDSEYAPSAPSRHSVAAATSSPPNLPLTIRTNLPLRKHPSTSNLEANLQHDFRRLSDARHALEMAQPNSYRDKVNIEASLAKIDEENMRIRKALASIHKETGSIREVLKRGEEEAKIEEALDLLNEAATPLEDLKMQFPPEDWEMDSEMIE